MNGPAGIEVVRVGKRYGDHEVLHEVSFEVGRHECVALLGHNGAGKTTLMKLLLGLTRPSGGRIRVEGRSPERLHGREGGADIGFLPENVAFNTALTGREVLRFYARLKRVDVATCDRLLDEVGLAGAARRRVATYSKGMRQRLGLAQALLGSPHLLLLDEPTTGLDPVLRETFYRRVLRHQEEGGCALISSHALTEIEARSDRVAILRQGRLVAFGTLAELRERAALPVRIRVTTSPGGAGTLADRLGVGLHLEHVNNRTLELACTRGEKLDLVARLAELRPAVHDVEIHAPGLGEVYAHYSAEDGPQ
ncbi:MAG: ABC transporter ATP-binding protein [Gammaproteobacteria bacterium]|nr:ABC transporter ATP-binding protein [Gammaproteobacteria bacterium]